MARRVDRFAGAGRALAGHTSLCIGVMWRAGRGATWRRGGAMSPLPRRRRVPQHGPYAQSHPQSQSPGGARVTTAVDHRGLADWVEIFRAGTHTDSAGVTRTYSQADLDRMVANHQPGAEAPLVIGHPTTDAPAWGWTDALRRVGDSLQMRVRDVHPQFEAGVEAGRYRKRSVRIAQGPNGWELLHVGFLGAAPPALKLAPIAFRAAPGETSDYEMDATTPSVLSRALRRLREWLIESQDVATADRVLPEWDISALDDQAARAREAADTVAAPVFAANNQGDITVPDFTQADLDAAAKAARDAAAAEFAAREAALTAELTAERQGRRIEALRAEARGYVEAGRLTPAMAQGLAEFMAALPDESTDARIEFAAGDGTEKQPPLTWLRGLIGSLPVRADLTREAGGADTDPGATAGHAEFAAPQGAHVDADRLTLHRKALDYQAAHPGTDYLTAVRAVDTAA